MLTQDYNRTGVSIMNLSVMSNEGGQLSRFGQKVTPCDFGIYFFVFDKKKINTQTE
jgi:hypothetical protein